MGSIIGVGIFNLPTSLASYGPISLVSMGLTTIGALVLAVLFASPLLTGCISVHSTPPAQIKTTVVECAPGTRPDIDGVCR